MEFKMTIIPPPQDDYLFSAGGRIFLRYYGPVIERSAKTGFRPCVIGYAKKAELPRWWTKDAVVMRVPRPVL